MLRKLIIYERIRIGVTLTCLVVYTTPFILIIGFGILDSQPGAPGGHVLLAIFFFVMLGVPWSLFEIRFFYRSSTRGVRARLARFGPTDELIVRIDHALKEPDTFFLGQASDSIMSPQPDCIYITENWLVRLCPGGSSIVHLPDLAWFYRRLVVRSALLSHGRYDDQLTCVMRNGDCWTFDTWSPLRTEQVIDALLDRRPEVLTGHVGEWIDLAAKPDALWAELLARRERLAAMSPAELDDWHSERWDECHTRILRQDRQAGAR